MSQHHDLTLPLNEAQVRGLALGDSVTLSGELVITAGLPTHQRMVEHIARGQAMPIDMQGAALLHFGAQAREVHAQGHAQTEIVYMNPTTSTRFNPLMPAIIRAFGLRVVGGKGGLDAASVQAMRDVGCVYLSFPGGTCTPAVQRHPRTGVSELGRPAAALPAGAAARTRLGPGHGSHRRAWRQPLRAAHPASPRAARRSDLNRRPEAVKQVVA